RGVTSPAESSTTWPSFGTAKPSRVEPPAVASARPVHCAIWLPSWRSLEAIWSWRARSWSTRVRSSASVTLYHTCANARQRASRAEPRRRRLEKGLQGTDLVVYLDAKCLEVAGQLGVPSPAVDHGPEGSGQIRCGSKGRPLPGAHHVTGRGPGAVGFTVFEEN